MRFPRSRLHLKTLIKYLLFEMVPDTWEYLVTWPWLHLKKRNTKLRLEKTRKIFKEMHDDPIKRQKFIVSISLFIFINFALGMCSDCFLIPGFI
jgi:hypothetical protein